jgi:hypothetical protein
MNFYEAKLTGTKSKVYVEMGADKLLLPKEKVENIVNLEKYLNTDRLVTFGIRPEDIHDDEEWLAKDKVAKVKVYVDVVEELGPETLIYAKTQAIIKDSDDKTLDEDISNMIAKVDNRSVAKAHSMMEVAFDMAHCHIFDKETEITIIAPNKEQKEAIEALQLKREEEEAAKAAALAEKLAAEEAKAALLACFRGVAWVSQDSQTLYNNLENALNTSAKVISISAVFDQGSAVIYLEDTLDSLRSFLTVTATYDNEKTLPVLNYDLSGQLTVGTSVITVTYKSKTTTFNVIVGEPEWGSDYTWLYRPSENGLLSEDENVSEMAAINGTFGTETLSGDVLNITAPYTGNASSGNIYKLIPLVCTNAVLKAKVKFNSLAESTVPSGLRMQLSNGTKGAQIFAFKHKTEGDYRISSQNEGVQVKLAEIQLNRWYILSCEIKPNNTQTLKIDDAVYNINALSSYAATESRAIVQQPGGATDVGNVNVDIAWIAFKNNAS